MGDQWSRERTTVAYTWALQCEWWRFSLGETLKIKERERGYVSRPALSFSTYESDDVIH